MSAHPDHRHRRAGDTSDSDAADNTSAATAASDATVSDAAARWVVRRDAGLSAPEEATLARWLAADARHRAAFDYHARAWSAFDGPARADEQGAMVRGITARARRRRNVRVAATATAAAACVLAAFAFFTLQPPPGARIADASRPRTSVSVVQPERRVLDDGSVVELRPGAVIEVRYAAAARRVVLTAGEAHFQVAKNPARPFMVEAGGMDVRAVGTAFAVQLGAEQVEILVTEGRVAVEKTPPAAAPALPPGSARVPRAASGVPPDTFASATACAFQPCASGLGRDTQAGTRDACAPQKIPPPASTAAFTTTTTVPAAFASTTTASAAAPTPAFAAAPAAANAASTIVPAVTDAAPAAAFTTNNTAAFTTNNIPTFAAASITAPASASAFPSPSPATPTTPTSPTHPTSCTSHTPHTPSTPPPPTPPSPHTHHTTPPPHTTPPTHTTHPTSSAPPTPPPPPTHPTTPPTLTTPTTLAPVSLATLGAGEHLVVKIAPASPAAVVAADASLPAPTVATLTPAEINARLAWRVPRMEFSATPLAEAVALINRSPRLPDGSASARLVLTPELAALASEPVSGIFRADNMEAFVQLLGLNLGIEGERAGDEIILRKARR